MIKYEEYYKLLSGEKISQSQFVEFARKGVDKKFMLELSKVLGITIAAMSMYLPVSTRTLQRSTADRLFPKNLSDSLLHIAEIYRKTFEVFENKDNAIDWLFSENLALGGKKPMDMVDTIEGIQLVKDILIRIEHGIFS